MNDNIIFDTFKPDETIRKLMDVLTLRELGCYAPNGLRSGLELAYAGFPKNSSQSGM